MQQGKRTANQNGGRWFWLMVALLAVAILLALVLVGMLLSRGRQPAPVPEEPQAVEEEHKTVTMGGQQVIIDESLPQNELEPEHFSEQEDGSMQYTGQARYGIDVSSHQGEIDWQKVAEDGVEFAMLRIGYRGYSAGALNEDSQFAANLQGARENGLDVGVYFFSQAITPEEAEEEAQQVLDWLGGNVLECPIAYDWEPITDDVARTDDMDGEGVTACAKAFCGLIASKGYTPAVYCNGMLGYLSYDLNELSGVELWYAEYSDYPSYAYEVSLWQYTNEGQVNGVAGSVDRNIWFVQD